MVVVPDSILLRPDDLLDLLVTAAPLRILLYLLVQLLQLLVVLLQLGLIDGDPLCQL
jgi:hypothetical protein